MLLSVLCLGTFGVAFCSGASLSKDEGVVNIFINTIGSKREQQLEETEHSEEQLSAFETAWVSFKSEHDKVYSSSEEELRRKQIFSENLKLIESHNYLESVGLKSYKLGVNQFADWELSEFKELMNGFRYDNTENSDMSLGTFLPSNVNFTLPQSVDWRKQGFVTPVKDQGHCGSCWSFSTTGSLEGQTFRKTHQLVSLSEQNLVDCSKRYGNHGCNGGLMSLAFKYIIANRGIDTEASYPYVAKDTQPCKFKKESVGATAVGYKEIVPRTEPTLLQAVAEVGPISVAIDANHNSFMLYKSGVYDEPKCTHNLDHAVLLVGYGQSNGKDYWLVKNSWGTKWGDQGYVMMSRNKNNQCGIALMAGYPVV